MSTRVYNIVHFIENGLQIKPWKLIFDYRYIRDDINTATQAYVNVYVTVNKGNPVKIVSLEPLYISTSNECNMTKFTTQIMEGLADKAATGIYIEIVNVENIEIKRAELAFNKPSSMQTGSNPNTVDGISLTSFLINNGSLLTIDPDVVLTNTVIGTASQYRVGKLADVSDGTWTTYSTSIAYDADIGANTLYFQVRNADLEVSNIMSASIVVQPKQFLQDIDNLRDNLDYDFVLTRSLDYNKDSSYDPDDLDWEVKKLAWTTGSGWTPINNYTGTFDGAGFTISNLVLKTSILTGVNQYSLGLFASAGIGMIIKNLGLLNVDIVDTVLRTRVDIGALLAVSYTGDTIIDNCYSTGSISTTAFNFSVYAGGLIGTTGGTSGCVVTKCWSSCSVYNPNGASGGLIGTLGLATFENCYSMGSVTGYAIIGLGIFSGGFAGYTSASTVTNCYSVGACNGCGFSRDAGGNTITSCYWDTESSGSSTGDIGTGKTTAEMKQQATFIDWDFTDTWDIVEDISYPTLQ